MARVLSSLALALRLNLRVSAQVVLAETRLGANLGADSGHCGQCQVRVGLPLTVPVASLSGPVPVPVVELYSGTFLFEKRTVTRRPAGDPPAGAVSDARRRPGRDHM
jgi:hypothetical protein